MRVDEAPNEPGRGNTINPQMFAGRPGPSTIILGIASPNLAVRRMRLVGREASIDRALRVRQGTLHLLARLTGKEITGHDRAHLPSCARELLPRPGFTQLGELVLENIEPLDCFRIFARTIE